MNGKLDTMDAVLRLLSLKKCVLRGTRWSETSSQIVVTRSPSEVSHTWEQSIANHRTANSSPRRLCVLSNDCYQHPWGISVEQYNYWLFNKAKSFKLTEVFPTTLHHQVCQYKAHGAATDPADVQNVCQTRGNLNGIILISCFCLSWS